MNKCTIAVNTRMSVRVVSRDRRSCHGYQSPESFQRVGILGLETDTFSLGLELKASHVNGSIRQTYVI